MEDEKKRKLAEYNLAVAMYEQYRNDVVKVGGSYNLHQILTLQLLEQNFKSKIPNKKDDK